ncbi:MAG TPA: DegT/DnrJ/EryC1/StrS family aminotransferase, partial [Vicinamibacterales bacterium]|nr:DegT/DnrJ/EryC1/StrS family aminotransferase [Vicinamibacterales bacterium]
TTRRRMLARRYRTALAGTDTVVVPREFDDGHVYHLFPVLSTSRASLQAHLTGAGVETLIHYPIAIPKQPAMADQNPAACPIAERVSADVLSLPLYPSLDPEAVDKVADAIAAWREASAGAAHRAR